MGRHSTRHRRARPGGASRPSSPTRTRLVAVTAASNLIGTRPDLPAIAEIVRRVGALLWVDGVHATAHVLTDVPASGADFWVCSPYKFLGPHLGVLAASPTLLETLQPAKLVPSSDAVPERFELGTLPYDIATISPSRNSLLVSAARSMARYSASVNCEIGADAMSAPSLTTEIAGRNRG